jgi:hypothetical protein
VPPGHDRNLPSVPGIALGFWRCGRSVLQDSLRGLKLKMLVGQIHVPILGKSPPAPGK